MPVHLSVRDDKIPSTQDFVACFCADWCDTCRAYQTKFNRLSEHYPKRAFVWVDIEDHPELLGEEEVENFPTLLVMMQGRVRFFGAMLPHISHLERLLDSLDGQAPALDINTALPSDIANLLAEMVRTA